MARRLAVLDADLCVGCMSCVMACSRRFGEGGYGRSAIAVRSAGGIERGFVVIICRACPSPPCAKVCPEDALVPREGGGVRLIPDRCISCGMCVDACPFGAVFWDEVMDKPSVCVHCGYCVEYCPYGVIGMVEVSR